AQHVDQHLLHVATQWGHLGQHRCCLRHADLCPHARRPDCPSSHQKTPDSLRPSLCSLQGETAGPRFALHPTTQTSWTGCGSSIPGSWRASPQCGLRPGDEILVLNGRCVSPLDLTLIQTLFAEQSLDLRLRRDGPTQPARALDYTGPPNKCSQEVRSKHHRAKSSSGAFNLRV
ncbi:hypothetical protein XENOCAPTIV_017807, partial [Xenoophorus captivus]